MKRLGSITGTYTMTFSESVRICFAKYADFTGRASRSEFWWFWGITSLAIWFAGFVENQLGLPSLSGYTPVAGLAGLLTFIPSFAVLWRRFHDAGRPGWHFFLIFLGHLVIVPGLFAAFVFVTPDYVWKPLIGLGVVTMIFAIIYFLFLPIVMPSQKGENRYGPEPLKSPVF